MNKFPLNQNAEFFRWGPNTMQVFFGADFLEGIFDKKYFSKHYKGHLWPKGLALYKGGRMVFVNEFPELRKWGGKLFLEVMLPKKRREMVYKRWKKDLKNLKLIERKINKTRIGALSKKSFLNMWKDFHATTITFWNHITVPELANYGSIEILEKELQKYVPKNEIPHVMETLTSPEHPSFYQEEEFELEDTHDIKKHQKKYFWIKNSYNCVEVVSEDFFINRKQGLEKYGRKRFEKRVTKVRDDKEKMRRKYRLPEKILEIAKIIFIGIEWQDKRKSDILQYLHYKNILIEEVAKREKLEKKDLLNFRELEIGTFLEGTFNLKKRIPERRIACGFLCAAKVKELSVEKALLYWDMYAEEKAQEGVKEIRGIIASKGNVKGNVKIILNPYGGEIKDGEILVAPMTTAEYIFLMKKSGAIITDSGGLTSHAAIVSRELNKPCIIGTKIATKVLKDGDFVEVDAERGVVRIIEK